MGRFGEARDDFESLIQENDPSQLQRLQESQGLNYQVLARAWQAHALWCLGRPDAALESASPRRCVSRASSGSRSARPSPPPTAPCSSSSGPTPPRSAGRRRRRSTSRRSSRPSTTARGPPSSSPTAIRSIAPEANGLARLRGTIESFKQTGARLRLPYYLALLADAHLRAGEADAGLEVVEEALSLGREIDRTLVGCGAPPPARRAAPGERRGAGRGGGGSLARPGDRPGRSRRGRWSCAPPVLRPRCGPGWAGCPRPEICCCPSTPRSRKASIRLTFWPRGPCSPASAEAAQLLTLGLTAP